MRINAEDIDDEYYFDIILTKDEIQNVLSGEFLQGSGCLGKKQLNILIATKENYRYGKEERK